jgi:hypothetical protein
MPEDNMKITGLKSKRKLGLVSALVVGIVLVVGIIIPYAPSRATTPVATAPFSVSVFATSVPGQYTQPGAIAFTGGSIYVAYSNGAALDGSSGSTTIVQYSLAGAVGTTFTVPGANAVLKTNPQSGLLWALQNPAGNSAVTIINASNGNSQTVPLAAPAQGGGYADVAFLQGDRYITASTPSGNPNTAPAILNVAITEASTGNTSSLTPVLAGNAQGTDSLTGSTVSLNLQSPTNVEFDNLDDLIMNDRTDSQLITVHNLGAPDQSVYSTPLTLNSEAVQIRNTAFVTSANGTLYVSDPGAETVYAVTKPLLSDGKVYTTTGSMVAKIDLDSGQLTPVVTGLVTPTNVTFIANNDFRLSFNPNEVDIDRGGSATVLLDTNHEGGFSGDVTINAVNAIPKGLKLGTAFPFTLSSGVGFIQIRAAGKAPTGIFGIAMTATDSSGRVRNAVLDVNVEQ